LLFSSGNTMHDDAPARSYLNGTSSGIIFRRPEILADTIH